MKLTVPVVKPIGVSRETDVAEIQRDRACGETVSAILDGSRFQQSNTTSLPGDSERK